MPVFLAQYGVTKGDCFAALIWLAVLALMVSTWERIPLGLVIFYGVWFLISWGLRILRWVKTWRNTVWFRNR